MGVSDCELLRSGWLAQPANAWSSGAYLVAGAYLLVRSRGVAPPRRAALVTGAVCLALVAVGSAAFHGPQPSWADIVHDASIAAVLVAVLLRTGPGRPTWIAGALLVAAAVAVLGVRPQSEALVHGSLVVAAGAVELRRYRAGGTVPAVVLATLAAGVALLVLGRTGGPLCLPGSPAQAHAGWHVLSAVAAAGLLSAGTASGRSPTATRAGAASGR